MNLVISPVLLLIVFSVSVSLPTHTSEPPTKRNALVVGGIVAGGATLAAVAGYTYRHANDLWASCVDSELQNGGVLSLWSRLLKKGCTALRPTAPMEALRNKQNPNVAFVLSAVRDRPPTGDEKKLVEAKVLECLRDDALNKDTPMYDANVKRFSDNIIERAGLPSYLKKYCMVKRRHSDDSKECTVLRCAINGDGELQGEFTEITDHMTHIGRRPYYDAALSMEEFKALGSLLPVDDIKKGEELLPLWAKEQCHSQWKNDVLMYHLFCKEEPPKKFWGKFFDQYSLVSDEAGKTMLQGLRGVSGGWESSGFLAAIPGRQMREVMKLGLQEDPQRYYDALRNAWIDHWVCSQNPNPDFFEIVGRMASPVRKAVARLRYFISHDVDYADLDSDIGLIKQRMAWEAIYSEFTKKNRVGVVGKFAALCPNIYAQLATYILDCGPCTDFFVNVLQMVSSEDVDRILNTDRYRQKLTEMFPLSASHYYYRYLTGTTVSLKREQTLDKKAVITLFNLYNIQSVAELRCLLVLIKPRQLPEELSPRLLCQLLDKLSTDDKAFALCGQCVTKLLGHSNMKNKRKIERVEMLLKSYVSSGLERERGDLVKKLIEQTVKAFDDNSTLAPRMKGVLLNVQGILAYYCANSLIAYTAGIIRRQTTVKDSDR